MDKILKALGIKTQDESLIKYTSSDIVIKSLGDYDSGRVDSDNNSPRHRLEKGLAVGFMGADLAEESVKFHAARAEEPRPENANLINTHAENFHSDADKQMLDYLTSVEKIDTYEPSHSDFSTAVTSKKSLGSTLDDLTKSDSNPIASALDDLVKGFPMPPKAGAKAKKPAKDDEEKKEEKAQEKDLGFKKKSMTTEALDSLIGSLGDENGLGK